MDDSPNWFVESASGRVEVEIVEVTWTDISPVWNHWLEMAAENKLSMPDEYFSWENMCLLASLASINHVVALVYRGEILGLLAYRDSLMHESVRGATISVRPDCRSAWPNKRTFEGIGTCLAAYLASQSTIQGWSGRVELGEVLDEAHSFFVSLNAETIGTTYDNGSIMQLSEKAGQELVKRYESHS